MAATLLFPHLYVHLEIKQDIEKTLTGRWEAVAVQLSLSAPPDSQKITGSWIDDVKLEAGEGNEFKQSKVFLTKLKDDDGHKLTAERFAKACDGANLGRLASVIRDSLPRVAIAPPAQPAAAPQFDAWNVTWGSIRIQLIMQLPPDALASLRTAFNFSGATSVANFFDTLDSTNFFTGPNRKANLGALLYVLDVWKDISAVVTLAAAVKALP